MTQPQTRSRYPNLLQPFRLRHVTFRNRFMSTSHAPGYVEDRRIYAGGDALCLHNPATERKRTMPHVVQPGPGPRPRS